MHAYRELAASVAALSLPALSLSYSGRSGDPGLAGGPPAFYAIGIAS